MSRDMIIAVPAWGEQYCKLFLGPVLATHRAAIDYLHAEYRGTVTVRYVVQTDDPIAVMRALKDFEVTIAPPPPTLQTPMRSMTGTHQRAIEIARENDRVVLLNADIMLSTEALVAIERRFRSGKKAIVCAGTRTTVPFWRQYPDPMPSRRLLAWAMRYMQTIPRSCIWGEGRSQLPWGVYFKEAGSVVLRAFHLHPLAIVKDRVLPFTGTIDLDLIENYKHGEVHIVTDPDEMALAEISPAWRTHGDYDWTIDVGSVVAWALRGARPMHWWNFRHRILLQGSAADVVEDHRVAHEVLRLCPYPAAIEAAI